MSSKQILTWLEDGAEDVARLLAPSSDGHESRPAISHATRRLYDARPALPGAQAFDSDRVSSSGSASKPPPGFGQDDRAQADRDEAHRRAKRIREDADWLVRCAQRWSPREPTPKDRELSSLNQKDDPPCEHCSTIGKWSAARQGASATTINGNLTEPKACCAFCYAYCRDTGVLPTRKQLEDHHNGVRVKRPA